MPSRFRIREFEEQGYYHIFHRGIEKKKVFLDNQDYRMFLYYLKVYLQDPKDLLIKYPQLPPRLQAKNLTSQITLIAYCLMPNHFHLLLQQSTKDAISKFMKQLLNAYTFYFNKKYERTGAIFEGRYKATRISSDDLLIHVARYIHLNPVVAKLVNDPGTYKWSSQKDYLTDKNKSFVNPKTVLSFFKTIRDYQNFVKDQISYAKELAKIKHLTID
jgi:putative transposase